MDAIVTALAILGGITLMTTLLSAWTCFRGDRSGNSGRFKHWSEED